MGIDKEQTRPKRFFLGWDRPVVDLAVEHLLARIDGGQGEASWVDLSDLLVVVPTRNAGRRLREALAIAVSDQGGALLPPQVRVPEDFLRAEKGSTKVAGPTAARLAWIECLQEINLDEYEVLFPVKPPEQGFAWATKVAGELAHARAALAEGGMLVRDLLGGEMGEALPERERWENIARLETRVSEALDRVGLAEPEGAKIKAARSWEMSDEVKGIILMVAPDPLNLAIEAIKLDSQRRQVKVSVCIHAPESLAGAFDPWGRPEAEFWQQRILLEPGEEHIYLAANPEGQKEAMLAFLRKRREQEKMARHAVAVGCADGDVLPLLRRGLQQAGVAVFDPDGEAFRKHTLYHFLANFSKLLRDGRFRDFLEMLRNPAWLDSLEGQFKETKVPNAEGQSTAEERARFDVAHILQAFDSLYERVLPGSFDEALEALRRDRDQDNEHRRPLPGQWLVGDAVKVMLTRFHDLPLADAFAALLADWLGKRQLRPDEADAHLLLTIAERSRFLAEEMSQVIEGSARIDPADLFELLLEDLAELRYYPGDRHASDLELQGWLELPWESADDLVICGFNDGLLPASVVGDMFLPESARRLLGLKNNEDRFARDLYLLESMLTWRLQRGNAVRLVVGKVTGSGDLLKPSRLLFQCGDSDLPRRALRLFAEDPDLSGEEESVPAWNLAWKLQPPFDRARLVDKEPTTLSATTFSSYLACPFRFILKRILGMEEVDTKKMEMDARDFGSLCHSALEVLAAGSNLAVETNYEEVCQALVEALGEVVRQHYGPRPPATILLQAEVAANRLKLAARYHVDALNEGWQVVATERVFGKEDGEWLVAGMPLTGMIDRIEKNTEGRYRLIDYKTSGRASSAFEAHLQILKRTESAQDFPDWMLYELPEDGKTYRWINLQLPVYCLWAEQHLAGEGKVDCAYVNLPKAMGDGGYSPWQGGMDGPLLRSARRCAEGVVGQVQKGHFWPPTEKIKYDDFEKLGFPGFVDSLDESAFEKVFAASPDKQIGGDQ